MYIIVQIVTEGQLFRKTIVLHAEEKCGRSEDMVRFANGFYSFSDSYLKSMKKQDLINYIRTIEKNWENALITNDIQYANCKRLLEEERAKAIDEFVKAIKEHTTIAGTTYMCEMILIAEKLKGGAE